MDGLLLLWDCLVDHICKPMPTTEAQANYYYYYYYFKKGISIPILHIKFCVNSDTVRALSEQKVSTLLKYCAQLHQTVLFSEPACSLQYRRQLTANEKCLRILFALQK